VTAKAKHDIVLLILVNLLYNTQFLTAVCLFVYLCVNQNGSELYRCVPGGLAGDEQGDRIEALVVRAIMA